VSCGVTHSRAHELLQQGYRAALVAATLATSRSSLYYRPKVRRSRADRRYDELIIAACGEKPTFRYRRVTSRLLRKCKLCVNHKRMLRVMRGLALLVLTRHLRARRHEGRDLRMQTTEADG
jgi:hypothetical protein